MTLQHKQYAGIICIFFSCTSNQIPIVDRVKTESEVRTDFIQFRDSVVSTKPLAKWIVNEQYFGVLMNGFPYSTDPKYFEPDSNEINQAETIFTECMIKEFPDVYVNSYLYFRNYIGKHNDKGEKIVSASGTYFYTAKSFRNIDEVIPAAWGGGNSFWGASANLSLNICEGMNINAPE